MLQSFNFPNNLKVSIILNIKKDIKGILNRSIIVFSITTFTSLPLVLLSDTIKNAKCENKHAIFSIILGILSYSIYYYIKRFYKLFTLKENIESELYKEIE